MNKKLLFIFVFFLFFLTIGAGCKKRTVEEATKPVTLNYWRVFDGQDDFAEIIEKYNAQHPYININYRKLRYDEYEEALLNAFAEDRGPDIFSIHNTWMRKYESKLEPLPSQTSMIFQVSQGAIKKELVAEKRIIPSINLKELKQNFADVVYSDVVINGKVYGLPLSVDTLAMYYNQDLLDSSGVLEVPQYWNNEFQETIKRLSKLNLKGDIIQSGVALGTADNVERFSDILSILMMQNGSTMMSDAGQILFHTVPAGAENKNYNPGQMALRFYNDFADPVKEVYSWNKDLPNSIDAFASGQVAIIFAYAYHLPTIRSIAPKLNFLIAPLPQIEGSLSSINFANYWVEVVSKKSQYKNEAWNFIQYMTRAEQVKTYLDKTKKPTALRSLISEQKKDLDLEVFADQVLTARSWYKGKNPTLMEGFLAEMVEESLEDIDGRGMEIMNLYANRIQQTTR